LLTFVRKHRLPLLALCDLIAPSMALGLGIGRLGCLMRGCCYGAVCAYPWAITFPADPPQYSPPYLAQVERGQMYGLTLSGNPKVEPRVLAVRADSPAEQAGLRSGDLLQSINGHDLETAEDAYRAIFEAFAQGQPLHMHVKDRPEVTVPTMMPPDRSLPVHPTQIYSAIDGLVLCVVLLVWSQFRRRDGEVFALMMTIYPVTRFLIERLRTDEAAIMNTGMSISQNVSLLVLVGAATLWFYVLRQPKPAALQERGATGGTGLPS
jgi:phosphatidylglycerol---prolipoprotein diacylglyceryl transferase